MRLEMTRIGYGYSDEELAATPSLFTIVNTNSPLKLDGPMIEGVIEMARHNQVVVITPFTLSGAMSPATIAGALAQQHAEAMAGMTLVQLVRPGAPVDLRRLYLQCGYEVRRPGLRHAGIYKGGPGRRAARPPPQGALPLLQRQCLQYARCAGLLRIPNVALGRGHGPRQPGDARRRLARGRALRFFRESLSSMPR